MQRKYDGDEIPGFTSYIHSEYRTREEYEYVNYWKWAKKETAEMLRLKAEVAEMEEEIERLKGEVYEAEGREREKSNEVHNLRTGTKTLEDMIASTKSYLVNYGTHHNDCIYWDLMQSGRIIPGAREKCSCKWNEVKEEAEKHLK